MEKLLRVVIVDDDFMIANIHRNFVKSLPEFQVVGVAGSAGETLKVLSREQPDLVLLDVYLPDKSGIEVLSEIRTRKWPCDVILVTAASQLKTVEVSLRLGVFDYLIKPFNLEILGLSLRKYAQYRERLISSTQVNQDVVDALKKLRATELSPRQSIESGIDARTLERVQQTLNQFDYACTSEEIAKAAGVSRSTARTYLTYMVQHGLAEERLSYGTVGRPRRLFRRSVGR